MLFNSYSYPAFLLLVFACYWLLPRKTRPLCLIAAGIVYYASYDVRYLPLIGGLSLVVYAVGQAKLRGDSSRFLLPLVVTFIVLVFVLFKYVGMVTQAMSAVTGISFLRPELLLPLGISFFTFEFIHYLVDTWRGSITRHSAQEFFSFLLFFPTLVSGPIKRFQMFRTSLQDVSFSASMIWRGVLLIALGYGMKYLLADPLVPFTMALAHPETIHTRLMAAGGLVCYSFRLYFDFAGLSNIAIGSSMLLGIIVPKNFDNPYFSSDIQAFWRRWHMSLSSWVRDYIYIALGGNRVGPFMTGFNLILAMAIVGLWHGASWNFAFWGVYHGAGLLFHRLWKQAGLRVPAPLGMVMLFAFVTLGWAFFVTTSLSDSILLLSKVFFRI